MILIKKTNDSFMTTSKTLNKESPRNTPGFKKIEKNKKILPQLCGDKFLAHVISNGNLMI
jgi:hypothetical protein